MLQTKTKKITLQIPPCAEEIQLLGNGMLNVIPTNPFFYISVCSGKRATCIHAGTHQNMQISMPPELKLEHTWRPCNNKGNPT